MAAPVVWSPEKLVNTTTAGVQQDAVVTALSTGGYVVSWSGADGMGSLSAFFQVYDSYGNKAGSEYKFASDTFYPSVAALQDGHFVITFQTAMDAFGNTGVQAQTFSDLGAPLSALVTVNSEDDPSAPEPQFFPSVTALSNGGYIVAYFTDHADGTVSVRMQKFLENGTKDGDEVIVGVDQEGTINGVSIAQTGNGMYALTWASNDPVDNDVVMQIYRPSGSAQTGFVPITGAGHQYSESLATNGTDKFLIAYRDGSSTQIYAQIRESDGDVVKAQFLLSDSSQNGFGASGPQVAALHGGGWFVIWTEYVGANIPKIIGQLVDADGNKVGGEIVVFDAGDASATLGRIGLSTLADGRVVVAWSGVAVTGDDTDMASVHSLILDPREGVITGTDNAESILGSLGDVDDTIIAKNGNDDIGGGEGDDTIDGGGGNDFIFGDVGADSMIGGDGDDQFNVDNEGDVVVELAGGGFDSIVTNGIDFTLAAGVEVEWLQVSGNTNHDITGNELAQTLQGDSSNNKLLGMGGNDTLDGGGSVDYMDGGDGDDVFYVDDVNEFVIEAANGGNDTVHTAITYSLEFINNVENLVLTGNGGIDGAGNSLANKLTGNANDNFLDAGAGNDTLEGGGGADTMEGDTGDDVYFVTDSGDEVIENNDAGTDTVNASMSYVLKTNFENLVLTGVAPIDGEGNAAANKLTGNAAANRLYGHDGNDTLDGKGGNDTMEGGKHDDIYVVTDAGDVVVEAANEGTDTVIAAHSYTLGTNLENLTLGGSAANVAKGNAAANVIKGNAAGNKLYGYDGNDTLDGRGGNDTMTGGNHNDTYVVADAGDVVAEAANQGTDTVVATLSYTLTKNVENLTLGGTSGFTGKGNALANTIKGNAADNKLYGYDGNDIIDGKGGSDTMAGGKHDDTYLVANVGDVVVETANEGTDTVVASRNYTLTANVEKLTLTGSAVKGTGNGLANLLTGNSGTNELKAGAGNDVLRGGTGKDLLWGEAGKDTFDFNTIAEIGNGSSSRDVIKDFVHLTDKIDLKTIDASASAAGNNAFTFVAAEGAAFTGVAGQLIWDQKNNAGTANDVTYILGDINGDKVADFKLELTGVVTLTSADFIL